MRRLLSRSAAGHIAPAPVAPASVAPPSVVSTCIVSVAIVSASILLALPAAASDRFHECRIVEDEASLTFDPDTRVLKRGNETIRYDLVQRQRLRELEGTCNTKSGRYRYATEVYGITVEFGPADKRVRRRFRCEQSSDGTPAGLSCDREVKSIDWQAPPAIFGKFR